MLFQSLDKIKRNSIMVTIILMFIGLILLLLPDGYFPFISFMLGFALCVLLVLSVLRFIDSKRTLMSYIRLSLGLLAGVWGFAFFLYDGLLLGLMSWLVGTLPILLGAYGIYHAFAFARRSGRKAWWILIVLSAFLLAFGGFVFWNPWMEHLNAEIKIIGGTLLYSAIISALSLIWIWPIRNKDED